MGNEKKLAKYESIVASIDESYIDNDYDEGSLSKNYLGKIWDVIQIHPDINAIDAKLKILDHFKKEKS